MIGQPERPRSWTLWNPHHGALTEQVKPETKAGLKALWNRTGPRLCEQFRARSMRKVP